MAPEHDATSRVRLDRLGNPHRSTFSAVNLALVVALVVGLAVAVLLARSGEKRNADAVIQISSNAAATGVAAGGGEGNSDGLVMAELLRLSGGSFRERLTEAAPSADFSTLTVTQLGTGPLVRIQITDASADAAVAAVRTVVEQYTALRKEELTAFVGAVQQANEQAITEIAAELRAIGSTQTTAAQARASALSTEYARLLATQAQLRVAAGRVDNGVTVLESPNASSGGATPRWLLVGVLAAIATAIITLALVALRRRVKGTLTSFADLSDTEAPIVLPAFPSLGRGWQSRLLEPAKAPGPIRLLGARLASTPASEPHGLALVGPTPDVGCTTMAVHLAVQSAQNLPTLLVCASNGGDGDLGRLLGFRNGPGLADMTAYDAHTLEQHITPTAVGNLWVLPAGTGEPPEIAAERALSAGIVDLAIQSGLFVIVDAPALVSSTAVLSLRASSRVALVVRSKVTTQVQLRSALDVLSRSRTPLAGVVFNEGSSTSWRSTSKSE